MFKLPDSCTHLICYQSNAQNSKTQASTVCELPDVQAGFRKSRGTRDQIANIHCIIEEGREFSKYIFCFIYYATAFNCVDHNKLWKIFKEVGITDHHTCLLRNLYADQQATVRSVHGTTEYVKAIYCYLAYLNYMQSTSCERLDWMKHKLESRFPGENQ